MKTFDESSKEAQQVRGAAILLCAMHHAGEIGQKSLQISVSGSAFGAVKLPDYIIEVYPAPQKRKSAERRKTVRAKRPVQQAKPKITPRDTEAYIQGISEAHKRTGDSMLRFGA